MRSVADDIGSRREARITQTAVIRGLGPARPRRGPYAHAQLVGGGLNLLAPDDHAGALRRMRAHGRVLMSMTHGDFEPEYLRALVLDDRGRQRLKRVRFAARFDSLMRGSRGAVRPRTEAELHPFRPRFVQMFRECAPRPGCGPTWRTT
jgi:hypothetical protein